MMIKIHQFYKKLLKLSPSKFVLRHKSKLLPSIFLTLAIIVFLTGIIISGYQWHSNQIEIKHVTKLISEANHGLTTVVPATVKPTLSSFEMYNVAPNYPRYIFIPSIGVRAIIGQVGLTANGEIGTPDNVNDTDWYESSSLPGESGAMLIDGHVSSWTSEGVFYNIKNLNIGDEIQIEKGDGSVILYAVVSKQIYNYQNVDMSQVLLPINPSKPGLNLITCTGDIIAGSNDFNQRIVVYASEIS